MSFIHWDTLQHIWIHFCKCYNRFQNIKLISKSQNKVARILMHWHLQWICDAPDALIRKMKMYFSSLWHNIDYVEYVEYIEYVDFFTLGILVHFLLGRHGWHPSAGEIKTWRTTFHCYTMRRYIAHITVTSHERSDVPYHRQYHCLRMHQLIQLTTATTTKHQSSALQALSEEIQWWSLVFHYVRHGYAISVDGWGVPSPNRWVSSCPGDLLNWLVS